ncbi:hypothetical protein [Pseudarthrobacter sp. NS4]|uniref:hypothetical protein n=1 Tax=Pseudarthrobacter sp. NS4 TaxID=2973976 RepID=UPI00216216DB|nr:hypothetical protein [Pseudarthrobacter sp. NS4]
MIRTKRGRTKAGVNSRETPRRRRLLLWSALPVLLLLCLAGKLLSVGLLAGQAASAFAAGDAAEAKTAAEGLGLANVVEPHKAPFAAGDAQVLAGDYAAARPLFEDALDAVPRGSADECIIRVNLSLAVEKAGDARLLTEDPASAAALYGEALDIVDAAPAGCFSAGAAGQAGEQLTEAKGRLNQKLAAGQPPVSTEVTPQEDAPEEPESPQQSQLEQLEDSARQAQRERNSGREREEYLRDTEYAPGPDRPW